MTDVVTFLVSEFDNSGGTVEYYVAKLDEDNQDYYSAVHARRMSYQTRIITEWCEEVFGETDYWGSTDLSSGWKNMHRTWYFCREEDRMAFLLRWDDTQMLDAPELTRT